jgi:hypothetical protein
MIGDESGRRLEANVVALLLRSERLLCFRFCCHNNRKNRVLRRMSGPKGEEVAGGHRKLHSEELHNLYPSPDIVRLMKSRG